MKRNFLLDGLAVAAVLVAGVSELAQVPAIAAKLAHRTAAPLARLARLGSTPSSPDMPLPAAQPFVVEAKACSESTAPLALPALPEAAEPVRIAPVTVRVLAIAPPVETVADPVAASAIVPLDARRIARAALIRRAVRAQIEQQLPGEVAAWAQTITAQTIDLTQREVQREIARAMAAQVRAERSKHAVTAQF